VKDIVVYIITGSNYLGVKTKMKKGYKIMSYGMRSKNETD